MDIRAAIEKAKAFPLTDAQKAKQRIHFAYGNASLGSPSSLESVKYAAAFMKQQESTK